MKSYLHPILLLGGSQSVPSCDTAHDPAVFPAERMLLACLGLVMFLPSCCMDLVCMV